MNINFKDYASYKACQVRANRKKLARVSATTHIECGLIAKYLKEHAVDVKHGICHGARNGAEVQAFDELLGGPITIGTDISDTATRFPGMVVWDFHEVNPDWKDRFDFVYSNAMDHSYDPHKAIMVWLQQLQPKGLLFLTHTKWHEPRHCKNQVDCFGATLDEYKMLAVKHGILHSTETVNPDVHILVIGRVS